MCLTETNNFIVFRNILRMCHEKDLYSQPEGRENFTVFQNEVPGRTQYLELTRSEFLYILDERFLHLQIFTLSR